MPSLIDLSFFIVDKKIPNTSETSVIENLNSIIARYEPECLRGVLGDALYELLQTETSERMTDLKSGVVYTDGYNTSITWRGLVYEPKTSLIANYVYYFFEENRATHSTGVSTSVTKARDGISVSPQDKMMRSWNFFAEEVRKLHSFLWSKNLTYPEFTSCIYTQAARKYRRNNTFGL